MPTQENPGLGGPGSTAEYVVSQCAPGIFEEGHDAVPAALRPAQVQLTLPPTDVLQFKVSQFPAPHSGGGQEQQQRPIALADGRGSAPSAR
jgi:hypothetical protein